MRGSEDVGPWLAGRRAVVDWRPYQRHLLEQAWRPDARADGRLHVVAPPGSGKTLLGLELVRRLGAPALILVPTTTIQTQWVDESARFAPSEPATAARSEGLRFVGTSLGDEVAAAVVTYQRLAVAGDAPTLLAEAARQAWMADLVESNRCADPAAAAARLSGLEAADATAYGRELRGWVGRLKRAELRGQDGPVAAGAAVLRFLHPNARQLIDEVVAAGVRTVVLDECHHLLDYWALVLHALVAAVAAAPGPPLHVIGLTATRPEPTNRRERANYLSLLGDVDVEVPLPALVRGGELAPWRDLTVVVEPTAAERRWLDDAAAQFVTAIGELTTGEEFLGWVVSSVIAPGLGARPVEPDELDRRFEAWDEWLRSDPVGTASLLRCAHRLGIVLPVDLPRPVEADEDPALEDWCVLIERWALDHLALGDASARAQLQRWREVLAPFGLSLSERGLRQQRSAGDLVLAWSAAKGTAAARIVAAEHAVLGRGLRAVVVCDVDRAASAPARLRDVLEEDAGTARQLLAAIVADPEARPAGAALVTGRIVLADAVLGEALAHHVNLWCAANGHDAYCRVGGANLAGVVELVGHGPQWSTQVWVAAVTDGFHHGVCRVLIGTRALLGEGWNAPRANTLVDLTGATTATAAAQLRGRVIRLDPAWPAKVAHCWDVACVAAGHPKGDADLGRVLRRHRSLWGVAADGAIVRGVDHLGPEVAALAARRTVALGPAELAAVNAASWAWVSRREATRTAWAVGSPYEDVIDQQLTVRAAADGATFQFARRPPGRRAAARWAAMSAAVAGVGAGVVGALGAAGAAASLTAMGLAAGLGAGGGWAAVIGLGRLAGGDRLGRRGRRPQRAEPALEAMATAVLAGFERGGLIGPGLLRASAGRSDATACRVRVEGAPAEARMVTEALAELLAPPVDPRHLLVCGDETLAVPRLLGSANHRAESFLAAWNEQIGLARLVPTRSAEGRRLLLEARARRPVVHADGAFERWR